MKACRCVRESLNLVLRYIYIIAVSTKNLESIECKSKVRSKLPYCMVENLDKRYVIDELGLAVHTTYIHMYQVTKISKLLQVF